MVTLTSTNINPQPTASTPDSKDQAQSLTLSTHPNATAPNGMDSLWETATGYWPVLSGVSFTKPYEFARHVATLCPQPRCTGSLWPKAQSAGNKQGAQKAPLQPDGSRSMKGHCTFNLWGCDFWGNPFYCFILKENQREAHPFGFLYSETNQHLQTPFVFSQTGQTIPIHHPTKWQRSDG